MKVVGRDYNSKKRGIYWMCECGCQRNERVPKQRSIRQDKLIEGRTLSCGCLKLKQKTRSKYRTNTFDMSGDYGIGRTYNGEEFIFDKEDYELIQSVSESWNFNDAGYLGARDMRENSEKYPNGRSKMVKLKDIVMSKKDGEIVKFRSDNKKDFRKDNLVKEIK